MAWKNYERIYHSRRLAKRNLDQHIRPFFGLGRGRNWNENVPRKVPVFGASPVFDTRQEAAEWALARPEGTHYEVFAYFGPKPGDWLLSVSPRPTRAPVGYRARLYERRGAPFREASMTWELEERMAQEDHLLMLKRMERKEFKGGAKPWRRKYHQLRRAAGNRAAHLALRGDLDGAEGVNLHVSERGIGWDIY